MNKAEIIFDAITGVRPGLIEEALDHRFARRIQWQRWAGMAAALALAVLIGFGAARTGVLGGFGSSSDNSCIQDQATTETAPPPESSDTSGGTAFGDNGTAQDTESKQEDAEAIPGDSISRFTATVLEVHESYLLVEPEEGESIRSSADRIQVSLTGLGELWDIQAGERIAVTWAGILLESYPAQLSQVLEIVPAE